MNYLPPVATNVNTSSNDIITIHNTAIWESGVHNLGRTRNNTQSGWQNVLNHDIHLSRGVIVLVCDTELNLIAGFSIDAVAPSLVTTNETDLVFDCVGSIIDSFHTNRNI